MKPTLRIGLVQTIAHDGAWKDNPYMDADTERRVTREIENAYSIFRAKALKPDFILLPEVTIPRGYERTLETMTEELQCITIGGLDFETDDKTADARNAALMIVPKIWREKRLGKRTVSRRIYKTYGAESEVECLSAHGREFKGETRVPIFTDPLCGSFAVAICFDIMDLQRLAIYRSQVQHLFVVAHNQDLTTFRHVAEAASRQVFCNVVICNTGAFGGSLAIAPYRDSSKRTIFRHDGNDLFVAQLIEIEADSIYQHQQSGVDPKWKGLPPGYSAQELPLMEVHKDLRRRTRRPKRR